MADRYRLSGTGQNWNNTTYWSATAGGASGASVPVATDTATFPSGVASSTITVSAAAASPFRFTAPGSASLWTITGSATNTLSFNVDTEVNVGGSAPASYTDRGFWFNTVRLIGTGVLTKTGEGMLGVGGVANQSANLYSGGTVVTGGWISPVFEFNNHFGTGTITFQSSGGTVGIVSGAALVTYTVPNQLVAKSNFSIGITGAPAALTFSGGISFQNPSATTTVTVAATTTVSGALVGDSTNTFEKAGASTLTVSAAGTFQGTVRTTAGTLALTNASAIQDAVFQPGAGGTTTFASNSSIGGLTGSGAFTLPTGTTTIGGVIANVTATYTGALAGTTQILVKGGTGTQTLGGASTRTTGRTDIVAGAIQLDNGNGLYGATGSGTTFITLGALWLRNNITTPWTAPLFMQGNGTGTSSNLRNISGSNTYAGTVTISSQVGGQPVGIYADAGTLTLSNTVTMNDPTTFAGAGTIVLSGGTAGLAAVTKSDAGTLKVTGASTKTAGAWTLNGGETWLSNANALGASGSSIAVATVAAGVKLYVTDGVTIPANKTISALAGTLGVTDTGGGTWSGAVVVSATGAAIENNTASAFTVSGGISPASSGLTLAYSSTGSITQSGIISSGANTLNVTKNGTGTTTFSAANTYAGTTTLAAGTANAGVADTPGTSGPFGRSNTAGSLLMTGGTLQYSASNAQDYSGRLAATGGQQWLIDTNGRSVAFNSVLANSSGTSSLTKLGSGTLSLTQSNTFSGNVTVSGGTLATTTSTALGSTAVARTFTVESGATLSAGSALTGYGASTLNLNGNGVSGTSGALVIASTGTHSPGSIILQAASWIRFTATGSLGSTVNNNGFDLTVAGTATSSMNGVISGSGRLIAGTTGNSSGVSLIGQNTYTGDTVLQNASVSITGSLGAGGVYASNISIGSGLTLTHAGLTQTFSGVISGAGALTKGGGNTLTLSGANTYTGKTSVTNNGVLSFNSIANVGAASSALGAPTTVADGTIDLGSTTNSGTIRYTGGLVSTDRVINLAGTTGGATITNSGTGTVTLTSDFTATGNGAKTLSFSGVAAVTAQGRIVDSTLATSVTYSGSSTLTLSGANTYTGTTTVSNTSGTIDISAGDNRLATTSSLTLSSGTVALGAANQTVNALLINNGGNVTGTGTLTATTFLMSSGTSTISSSLSVTQTTTKSSPGALSLNGSSSFGGAVSFSGGSVTLGAANTFFSTLTLGSASAITLNYSAANNFGGLGTIDIGAFGATMVGASEAVTLSANWSLNGAVGFRLPTEGSSLTLSGAIGGVGALNLGATGVAVGASSILYPTSTASTFSGSINIRNGAVYVTDVRQLGGSTKTISVAASGTGSAGFVLDGTSGNITLPSTMTFSTSSGTGVSPEPTYFGIVNVAGDNIIAGTVTMVGGGSDSYFTVIGGTLTILGNISASVTLRTMRLRGTGSGTISGIISNTNTPAVAVSGSSTWTLSGANTYAGGTTTSDTATVIAASTTALGAGNVTLGAGTKLRTKTDNRQNGKLTITGTFNNSAGGVIHIGYSEAIVISPSRALINAPTTDFSSTAFSISLDPAVITTLGQYAVIYSPVPLTNYIGAAAPTWTTPPSFSYGLITVTGAGDGDIISINGVRYYAVVVTIA
jgi:fibronectin-binding autotransporter adhesin